MDSVCSSNRLALSLQHLHHDLLFLDQESPHDLFPHSFVGEAATVGAIHLLVTPKRIIIFNCTNKTEIEKKTYRLMRDFSWLVPGLIPLSLRPVMGHLGTVGRFLRYWNTNFPPGVLTVFLLLDLVL